MVKWQHICRAFAYSTEALLIDISDDVGGLRTSASLRALGWLCWWCWLEK